MTERFPWGMFPPSKVPTSFTLRQSTTCWLFTAAKISHLGLLPQGQPERLRRALKMVAQMDVEGFGHCTLYGECQEACPKEISIDTIARMNRDYLRATVRHREEKALAGSG